jgi:hypothetical protein
LSFLSETPWVLALSLFFSVLLYGWVAWFVFLTQSQRESIIAGSVKRAPFLRRERSTVAKPPGR